MQLTFKNYKIIKTRKIKKLQSFLILTQNANKNSKSWIQIDQNIQNTGFEYFKTENKTTNLILNDSIYFKYLATQKSSISFLIPKVKRFQKKNILLKSLGLLSFNTLLIKINNKMYSYTSLNKINVLSYKKNIILFNQNKNYTLKKFNFL